MVESKGKVMLSINDHPGIRELFKGFRTTRLELAYSVSRDKTQKKTAVSWSSATDKIKSDRSVAFVKSERELQIVQQISKVFF